MSVYVGIAGKAHSIKKLYVGVGNAARKVKKAYIGVGGVARLFYRAGYGNCPGGLYAVSNTLGSVDTNIQYIDTETYAIKSSIKGPISTSAYGSIRICGTSGKLMIGRYKSNKPKSYYYENTYAVDYLTGASVKADWTPSPSSNYEQAINFGSDNFLGNCTDTQLIKRNPEDYSVLSTVTLPGVIKPGGTGATQLSGIATAGGDANTCYIGGWYAVSYVYAMAGFFNISTGAFIKSCHCTGHVGTMSGVTSVDALGPFLYMLHVEYKSESNINYFLKFDKNTAAEISKTTLNDRDLGSICTIK